MEYKLTKTSITTLKYIMEDIQCNKKLFIHHNNFFNKNWNKYYSQLTNLFNIMSSNLNKIMQNITFDQIDNYKLSFKNWINYEHNETFNYQYYLIKNRNITFEEFKINYNKRHISLNNINFASYIIRYSNLDIIDDKRIIELLNGIQNGIFVSLDIKYYIENCIDLYENYNFPNLNIDFFCSSKKDKKDKIKTIMNFYLISEWILILFGKSGQKINLVYFDTPLIKKIDKSYNFLSSQNVNSGSTSKGKNLMIWRSEESSKVLIHELLHYLNKDTKYIYLFNDIIKIKLGNIDYPILINETIIEIQAQFLHTIYVSNILCKNCNIDTFKILYNYEQIFSWYQFAKIMDFFSIKIFNEKNLINNFNQSSNVFSYYILKSILNLHFGDILLKLSHFIKLTNINTNNILDEYNNYLQLSNCINNYINKLPIKLINNIIKHFPPTKDTHAKCKKKLNNNSLNMSIFQLI